MNLFAVNKPLHHISFFILGLLFFSLNVSAQLTIEWDQTYGGKGYEEMGAAILTNDGGYIFGGITTSRTQAFEISSNTKDTVDFPILTGDYWVVKTNGNGDVLWDKRYGGFLEDRLWSIVPTPDGGFLVGGESRSGIGADRTWANRGQRDFWIVKIDENGNRQWDRAYGGTGDEELRKIIPLPNGQYWLAGFSNSPASFEKSMNAFDGTYDFWSVLIDENGVPLGDYSFGGGGKDRLFDAILAHDGNILLAGPTESVPGFNKTAPFYGLNDIWVVKCTPNGTLLWDAAFGGNREDVCQRLVTAKDGNYFAIGQSTSDMMSGNKTATHFGGDDIWLVKFTDNGTGATLLWDQAFGGSSSDQGFSLVETSLGNLQVLGESSSLADSISKDAPVLGNKDFWFVFADKNGNKLWDETLGGVSDDGAKYLLNAHDYGYILAGISNSAIYPPYKSDGNRGEPWTNDLFVIRTGCSFLPPVLEDQPKTCLDEVIHFDATVPGACNGCSYFWEDGNTGPIRNVSPNSTTVFHVTVLHPDGCEMSDSTTVVIVPGPYSFLADSDPISCFGENDASFFVESVAGIAPPFLFSLNGGPWDDNANYLDLGPGNYQLEILDTNGCKLDTAFLIAPKEEVLVELGPDIYLEYGDSVQLQALTNLTDSYSVSWGQPSLLSCADCLEPWVRPSVTTTFSIVLKDKNGCMAEDLVRVILKKTDAVYIPNSFSPNLDNINDFFTVFADRKVTKIKSLKVFDRWGELMFERSDFQPNNGPLGWDGSLNGRPLDSAVFIYWTEVEFFDGRTELFMGDVVLVR